MRKKIMVRIRGFVESFILFFLGCVIMHAIPYFKMLSFHNIVGAMGALGIVFSIVDGIWPEFSSFNFEGCFSIERYWREKYGFWLDNFIALDEFIPSVLLVILALIMVHCI